MKNKLLVACLMLIISSDYTGGHQPHKKDPNMPLLRISVNSVKITETNESSALIVVDLKAELINSGNDPIILLQRGPLFVGAVLGDSPDGLAQGRFLASSYGGPAVDLSPEWVTYHKKLDKPDPPPDQTRILRPKESWHMDASARFSIPLHTGLYSRYPKQESLDFLTNLPTTWISVICEIWPQNLELNVSQRDKLKFGHSLQNRWKRSGFLWLDNLNSEPVSLDLKQVTH